MLPPRAKLFDRFLRRENQAENIQIELPVEMLLGDLFEREEFINARVVDKNVELAKGLLRFGKQAFDVRFLGDVRLHRNRLAALRGDFADDLVRAGLAGSVVDDDGRAVRGELFGDGSADAFGRACDHGHFARQFI
jgi:hypothetical protein